MMIKTLLRQDTGRAILFATILVAIGLLVVGCGSGDGEESATPTAPKDSSAPTAPPAPDKQQKITELKQRLSSTKSSITSVRSDLETALPVADEELTGLLEQLDSAVSGADRALGGATPQVAQVESTLGKIDQLKRRAAARLTELKAKEEGQRQELRERLDQATKTAKPAAPDLFVGVNGEDYLVYKTSVIARVQQALKDGRFYAGPTNGKLDAETIVSIGRFQQVRGLQVSGIPSPRTRGLLLGEKVESSMGS